jgi:hypothetical protein
MSTSWRQPPSEQRAIDAFVEELDFAKLGFDGAQPEATGRPAYHEKVARRIRVTKQSDHTEAQKDFFCSCGLASELRALPSFEGTYSRSSGRCGLAGCDAGRVQAIYRAVVALALVGALVASFTASKAAGQIYDAVYGSLTSERNAMLATINNDRPPIEYLKLKAIALRLGETDELRELVRSVQEHATLALTIGQFIETCALPVSLTISGFLFSLQYARP